MNKRRRLVITLGSAVSIPRGVFAQAKKPPLVIGWLGGSTADSGALELAAFKEGMVVLGWKEGQQYVIDARWAGGRIERLQPLAAELAAKRPNIIVATNVRAALAAASATRAIPIVKAGGASPVDVGLAKSLARPGGMVTGLSSLVGELSAKYFELLLAAVPKLKRVGFLIDPASLINYTGFMKNSRGAAEHYRVEAHFADVAKAEEIEPAIARLAKEGVEGLILSPSPGLFASERRRILALALAQRWPVISGGAVFVEDGALLSYSADSVALSRRAAWYVDRILKGTKPGDLPIEQPTAFDLVVNLKAAKALGLTMPPEIMVRATRVIE